MARRTRTRSTRGRRSRRRGGAFFKNKSPLSSTPPKSYVPPGAIANVSNAETTESRAEKKRDDSLENHVFLARNDLAGQNSTESSFDRAAADLKNAQQATRDAKQTLDQHKEGTFGYFKPGEEGPQGSGRRSRRRRTRRRRGSRRA